MTGLLIAFCAVAQEVNFMPKALRKALKKDGVDDFTLVREMPYSEIKSEISQINGKYFMITGDAGSEYKYIYVGRVNSCRAGGCSISNDIPLEGSSEYFDYYILFDSEKVVREVKVFNYQATHGYEITSRGWLKQFRGHKDQQLQVGKDIDAISGATISVYAITRDIGLKTRLLSVHSWH